MLLVAVLGLVRVMKIFLEGPKFHKGLGGDEESAGLKARRFLLFAKVCTLFDNVKISLLYKS